MASVVWTFYNMAPNATASVNWKNAKRSAAAIFTAWARPTANYGIVGSTYDFKALVVSVETQSTEDDFATDQLGVSRLLITVKNTGVRANVDLTAAFV